MKIHDEESENFTLEKQIKIQYWFPNNGDPNSSNSVFNSQPEFINSLLKNKEPTLIFNSRNYRPDFKLTLPSLFPLHFSHLDMEELRKIGGLMCQQMNVSNIALKYHYQDFNMLTLF
jgi:hypothetical protein